MATAPTPPTPPTTPPTDPPKEQTALRETAPQVRTVEALYRENEKLLDAIAHDRLKPKQIDGMNTTLKAMKNLGVDLPLRLMALEQKAKGGLNVHGPMVRVFLGLPERAGRS